MLSRKEQNSSGNPLPQIWIDEILDLLNSIYDTNLKKNNRFIEIHGFTYPNELFISISLINSSSRAKNPITITLSIDLEQKTNPQKKLNNIVDTIGVFLDDYFSKPSWDKWQITWQTTTTRKTIIYYRITREDIYLTIQANELLK